MIRKIFLMLIAFLSSVYLLNAQVFNTAKTLAPLKFSAGIAPIYYNENFGLLLTGEAGIKPDIDFRLKYAVLEYDDYFGADLEWKLLNQNSLDLSLTTGCHVYYDFGLDVSGNLSYTLRNDVYLYTGLDMDLNFGNDLHIPLWLPLGIEVRLGNMVAFLFEAELPVSRPAGAIIDGGFLFRF